MNSYAQAFVDSREAVCELVATVPAMEWERVSPLTPKWNVREVLAHLVGVSGDVSVHNLPTGDMNEWTRRQVESGAGLSIEELVTRWRELAIEEEVNQGFGVLLFDQVTHEYDIRHALGRPGPVHSSRVRLAAESSLEFLRSSTTLTFRFRLDGEFYQLGSGQRIVELETSHFEFMRFRAGRRSWPEICALPWRGDLEAVRECLFGNGFFTPALFQVNEATT